MRKDAPLVAVVVGGGVGNRDAEGRERRRGTQTLCFKVYFLLFNSRLSQPRLNSLGTGCGGSSLSGSPVRAQRADGL